MIIFICIIHFSSSLSLCLQIYSAVSDCNQTSDGLFAARVSLRLQLQSSHFLGATQQASATNNNGLTLRCTAEIGDIYQRYIEKELGTTPNGDPIPARGKHACNLLNLIFYNI